MLAARFKYRYGIIPFHTCFFQASDPIQALFAEKIREYDTKKKAAGKVVLVIVDYFFHS
jgi:hypothetical protein